MFSFADENRASLVGFFSAALAARKEAITGPADKWTADEEQHQLLVNTHAPILQTSFSMLRGIHANAFLFEGCVVKTNLFGQYPHDGQCAWLDWCVKHQNNPLVPKIAFLVVDEETDRFLVIMEKLVAHSGFQNHEFREEIDVALKKTFIDNLGFFALAKKVKEIRANSMLAVEELRADIQLMREIEDEECERVLTESLTDHQITLSYIDQIEALWRTLTHECREAFTEVQRQWRSCTRKGHLIDLHSLNWMLRSNGEQVLLDPVN